MKQNRPVRIIKNEQRLRASNEAKPAIIPAQKTTERELKVVVSSWVREHQQRSEEYRRAFSKMLKENTLLAPRKPSLA
jgi:hypothetical protein